MQNRIGAAVSGVGLAARLVGCASLVGLAAGLAGCACGAGACRTGVATGSEVRASEVPAPAVAAAVWSLTFGSEGGFTGGGSGFTIFSDGAVASWSRLTQEHELVTQPAGRATPEALQALFKAMTAAEMRTLSAEERGNMTTFLEWRHAGESRRYSWAHPPRARAIPDPLARAYEAALAAAASASSR